MQQEIPAQTTRQADVAMLQSRLDRWRLRQGDIICCYVWIYSWAPALISTKQCTLPNNQNL